MPFHKHRLRWIAWLRLTLVGLGNWKLTKKGREKDEGDLRNFVSEKIYESETRCRRQLPLGITFKLGNMLLSLTWISDWVKWQGRDGLAASEYFTCESECLGYFFSSSRFWESRGTLETFQCLVSHFNWVTGPSNKGGGVLYEIWRQLRGVDELVTLRSGGTSSEKIIPHWPWASLNKPNFFFFHLFHPWGSPWDKSLFIYSKV